MAWGWKLIWVRRRQAAQFCLALAYTYVWQSPVRSKLNFWVAAPLWPHQSFSVMQMEYAVWWLSTALITWYAGGVNAGKTSFRAAVYEHVPFLPGNRNSPVSRDQALGNLQLSLNTLQAQATRAALQEADIFVFPEDALYGLDFSREGMMGYAEVVPDPERITWNPCEDTQQRRHTEVQVFLSCLARNTSLYLVVNVVDKQPCNLTSDLDCPQDGVFLYNTNLVFAPSGQLVSKYYKENLFMFEMEKYRKPAELSIATFQTPFGKFGVFTCFDVLFYRPAILLLEQHQVTNVVFPTAWMDALPLLAAVQFHSAFAMGAKINFLAANIHLPDLRFQGSGIYTPSGPAAYWYNTTSPEGRLLLADIDVIPERQPIRSKTEEKVLQQLAEMRSQDATTFTSQVFRDEFNFAPLESSSGAITVCQQNLCCHLEYAMTPAGGELYAFGVFHGLHTFEGRYFLQVCALLRCANNSRAGCGAPTTEAASRFSRLRIRGSFRAKYLFPEVLLSDNTSLTLAPGEFSLQDGELVSQSGFSKPLLSAALLGRVYEWDSQVKDSQVEDSAAPRLACAASLVMLAASVALWAVPN